MVGEQLNPDVSHGNWREFNLLKKATSGSQFSTFLDWKAGFLKMSKQDIVLTILMQKM